MVTGVEMNVHKQKGWNGRKPNCVSNESFKLVTEKLYLKRCFVLTLSASLLGLPAATRSPSRTYAPKRVRTRKMVRTCNPQARPTPISQHYAYFNWTITVCKVVSRVIVSVCVHVSGCACAN